MAFQLLAFLPLIAQGAGMMAQGAQGQKDAATLRAQGKAAFRGAVADSESMARDYRQLLGRQAATIAQGGGAYGGSAAKVLAQSESLANLDRLTTLYKGDLRRRGFQVEGDATSTRSSLLLGAQLLSMGSNLTSGRRIPGSY